MINPHLYEPSITRVRDVYRRFYWVSTRHLNDTTKTMIPLTNGHGLRRINTPAGRRDNQNMLHRDNIAEVLQERKIEL